jgi:hypothetical protein
MLAGTVVFSAVVWWAFAWPVDGAPYDEYRTSTFGPPGRLIVTLRLVNAAAIALLGQYVVRQRAESKAGGRRARDLQP